MQPVRTSELGFSRWIHLLKPGRMQLMDLAGVGDDNECGTVSYEIFPAEEKMPLLNDDEKKLLRTDLDLDDQSDLSDFYAAEIQATRILGKWWGNVEKGVSEGNEISECSKLHLPGTFATADCEKFVMTIVRTKRMP
jgi:hypothetical protein